MYKVSYMGDGSTTEFTFNFPFYENTNIIVTINGSTATEYTVVGTSAGLNADIPYTGGKIVFDIAPIATDSITISRSLPLTRIVDYQPTELINPTVLNQDQNYTMEILKDFNDKLDDMNEKYGEIIDTESTQTLIQKIDTVSTQITNLGDISTLRQNVSDLITTTGNHTTTIGEHTTTIASHTNTIGSHTTSIGALETLTNGMIDYVIESQNPTTQNNYTWYRKYKSGWIEMGGQVKGGFTKASNWNTRTITLPVTMADTDYVGTVMTTWNYSAGNAYYQDEIYCSAGTTTEMTLSYINMSDLASTICNWTACGKYAQ